MDKLPSVHDKMCMPVRCIHAFGRAENPPELGAASDLMSHVLAGTAQHGIYQIPPNSELCEQAFCIVLVHSLLCCGMQMVLRHIDAFEA